MLSTTEPTKSVQRRAREAPKREPSATPTQGPSTGELLLRDGTGLYLSATHGLRSGVQFQRVGAAGVGIDSVIAMGILDAVDVWGWVEQGVEVCFPQRGDLLFLDAATAPRTVLPIASYDRNGQNCVALYRAGTVVLLLDQPPTAVQPPRPLVNCKVTTMDILNLRANPSGAVIGAVLEAVTLTPLRRTPDWFEVRVEGILSWISADYVTLSGDCAG